MRSRTKLGAAILPEKRIKTTRRKRPHGVDENPSPYSIALLKDRIAPIDTDFLARVIGLIRVREERANLTKLRRLRPAPHRRALYGGVSEHVALIAATGKLGDCTTRQQRIHPNLMPGKPYGQRPYQSVKCSLGGAMGLITRRPMNGLSLIYI